MTSTSYNEQIFVNGITHCKRDQVYQSLKGFNWSITNMANWQILILKTQIKQQHVDHDLINTILYYFRFPRNKCRQTDLTCILGSHTWIIVDSKLSTTSDRIHTYLSIWEHKPQKTCLVSHQSLKTWRWEKSLLCNQMLLAEKRSNSIQNNYQNK